MNDTLSYNYGSEVTSIQMQYKKDHWGQRKMLPTQKTLMPGIIYILGLDLNLIDHHMKNLIRAISMANQLPCRYSHPRSAVTVRSNSAAGFPINDFLFVFSYIICPNLDSFLRFTSKGLKYG